MSSMEAGIHWFIARDGRQHGPVSDMEMRKLVELGHLRHTDLLWRQGFPDWRPAPAVFTPPAPAATPSAYAPARVRPQTASPTLMPRYEMTAGRGAQAGAAATAAAAAASHGSFIPNHGSLNGPQPGVAPGSAPQWRAPNGDARTSPQFAPAAAQTNGEPRFDAAAPYNAAPEAKPVKPRSKRGLAAVLVLLAIGGGGVYAAKKHGGTIKEIIASLTAGKKAAPVAEATSVATAEATTSAPATAPSGTTTAAVVPAAAAPAPPADKVAAVNAALQTNQFWQVVSTDFPDWYRDKVDGAARLSADGKTQPEVTKYLVQSLVELRRSQSEAALGASNETLKKLAVAFKGVVAHLAKQGSNTCMSFIMSGESHDSVVALIADPAKNTELNTHLLAVFTAVSEGRKAATAHADPADGDYKLLVAELVKGGWTQAELELFADPKGASRTTPERYCQMMQDFFTAHLSIADPAVQDRLLHRTLKLVVAG